MNEFKQSVIEKLGHYVYLLKDSRDKKVFYVGRGVGNRIFDHINKAQNSNNSSEKHELIRNIEKSGSAVEHIILRHNLSEKEAKVIESSIIDLLGLDSLTNIVKGFNSSLNGLMSTQQIAEFYDAEEVEISNSHRVMLITINKYFDHTLEEKELYDVTRYCWRVSSRRNKVEFVFSVYKGIVREVYKVEEWEQVTKFDNNPQDEGRWFFYGNIDKSEVGNKYRGKSIGKYVGSRNPIRYCNC